MRRTLIVFLCLLTIFLGIVLYKGRSVVPRLLLGYLGMPLRYQAYPADPHTAPKNSDDIRNLLTIQANDWNRGDVDAFAAGYKNSPDILFIGRKVARGYDQMLANYRKGYATRDAMGTLTFTQIEVQPLDARFATATGHYHLERTGAGGGNADGYFLLVLEKTAAGWKIVRDDTTALPSPAAH